MTVPVANTNLNDSFNTWRLNTNYISTIVSNNVITVTRAGGSAARGGSVKGDGHVSGTFSSTVLRTDTLKSGNTTVLGGDLTIASNTIIGGAGTDTHTLTVHANTIFNANVDFATTGTDRVNMGDVSRLIIGGGSRGQFLRLATSVDNPEFKSLTLRDITDMSSNAAHLILSGANSTFSANKNSPKLIFAGGENTADKVEVFLAADATAGDSDLYLKLVDAAGDSKLVITDSSDVVQATIDSDGSMVLEKDFHAKGNAEVDGTFKADGTSSLVDITTKAITANSAVLAKTTLEVAGKAHLKGSTESLEVDGTSKFSGAVDIDAGVDIDTGNAAFDVNTGTAKAVFSSSDVSSQFVIENVTDSADSAPDLALRRSTATPLDGDSLGDVVFQGHSVEADGTLSTDDESYARIQAVTKDSGGIVDNAGASDGLWEGKLIFDVNKHGSAENHVLEMTPDDIAAKKTFYTEAAAHLKGDLSVVGDTTLKGSLSAEKGAIVGTTLEVVGDTTLKGDLSATKAAVVGTTLEVVGDTTLKGDLSATKAAVVGTTLEVGTDTTIKGNLSAEKGAVVGTTLEVVGDTTLKGSLSAEKGAIVGTTLEVVGDTTLKGSLSAEKGAIVGTTLEVLGDTTLKGNLSAEKGAVVGTTLAVGTTLDVGTTLEVLGDTTLKGDLSATKAAVVGTTLEVVGDTTLKGDLSATKAAVVGTTLEVAGDTTLKGSLSAEKGAIVGTTLEVAGDTTLKGDLSATKAAVVGTTLEVVGDTTLKGSLSAEKGAVVGTTLEVDGDTTLTGDVRFDGKLSNESTTVFGTNGKLHANNTISDDTILNSMIQNDHVEFQADSGTNIDVGLGQTVDFAGGTGISTATSANTVTITAATATASVLGVASFDTNDFDVSSGAVTLGDSDAGAVIGIKGTTNEIAVSRTNGTVTVGIPDSPTLGIKGSDVNVIGNLVANGAIQLGELFDTTADSDARVVLADAGALTTMNVYANTIFHDQVSIPAGIVTTSSSVLSAVEVTGTSSLKGNVDLGGSSTQTVSINGKIDTNIIPNSGTEDIGSASAQFDQAFLKGVTVKGDIAAEKGAFSSSLSVGGDLTVTGDLTVSGTTTTINTATMDIADNMFKLNSDFDSETAPTENAGLAVNRGNAANVEFRWNESDDDWQLTKNGTDFYDILTAHETSISGLSDLGSAVTGSDYIVVQDANGTDGLLKKVTITEAALKGVKGAVGPQGDKGVAGDKGNSVIIAKLYKRAGSTPPTTVTGDNTSSYNFSNNTFTPKSAITTAGWSATIPAIDASNPDHGIYVIQGTFSAVGTGTDSDGTTWSAPALFLGAGEKGDKGEVGNQGAQGDKGNQGNQGPQGDKGNVGPQGDKGNVGPQGATGATNTTTGLISTTNYVQAGRALGSVALASDDGGGDANITFNHMAQTPDITGNVGRITVNVDDTNDASMSFSLAENKTSGSSYSLVAADKLLTLSTDNGVRVNTKFVVEKGHSVLKHVNASNSETELINNKGEWIGSPTGLKGEVGDKGNQGAQGDKGVAGDKGNSVLVQKLYKRAATATTPTDTASTYNFSTNVIGGLSALNTAGWYTAPPTVDAGFNPLWVIVGTYSAVGTGTDSGGTTWSTPTKLADAGQKGEIGAQGDKGDAGDKGNSVIVFKLYQRAASATAITDDSSSAYNFATGVLSNIPSGWSITPVEVDASNPSHPLFVTTTTYSAVGTGTDTGGSTWSTPVKLVGSGQKGEVGNQGNQGAQGVKGADGNFGGASFNYKFQTETSELDPGAGNIRFNASVTANVNEMYIDNIDSATGTTRDFLTTIDDSTSPTKGHFRISNRLDATDYAIFSISGITTTNTGYIKVLCAFVSGTATSVFGADEDVIVTFARTGDVGAQGDKGNVGPQGNKGEVGNQGNQGPQGDKGNQGNQGPQGNKGNQGNQGPQGDKGVVDLPAAPGGDRVMYYDHDAANPKHRYATLDGLEFSGSVLRMASDSTTVGTSSKIGASSTNIECTTNAMEYDVGGTTGARLLKENGTDVNLYIKNDIIAFATALSDSRLKENITKIDNALDKVDQLNGYTFDYIHNGKAGAGVIAQEVEEILPSAVTERETSLDSNIEGAYKTVAYDQLSSLFIESIKELRKENQELRQMIEELGNK